MFTLYIYITEKDLDIIENDYTVCEINITNFGGGFTQLVFNGHMPKIIKNEYLHLFGVI